MEPRLEVITLAVADLERALAFYRDLSFESKGIIGTKWTDEVTAREYRLRLAKDAAIPV